MKYLVIVFIVLLSGGVGKIISDKYKNRVKCYKNLIKFADFLKLNIYSLNENIVEIIDKFILINEEFKSDFEEIKEMIIKNNLSSQKLKLLSIFKELNDAEMLDVFNFFNLLGKNNFDLQISLIENYLHIFNLKLGECEVDMKQKGNISYKISLCVGVMISIIIV